MDSDPLRFLALAVVVILGPALLKAAYFLTPWGQAREARKQAAPEPKTRSVGYGFFVLLILPVAALVAGSVVTVAVAKAYVWGKDSESWSSVGGVVERSRASGCGSDACSVQVRYAYQVGGVTYRATRVDFDMALRRQGDLAGRAYGIVARYPAGDSVRVYVHPDHPGRSVLEPGRRPGWWAVALIGLIFLLIGAAALPLTWTLAHALWERERVLARVGRS